MARSKVISRSHNDIAHLQPQPMSLPSINFLHLMVSEIQPRQTFYRHPTTHPPKDSSSYPNTMNENNTQPDLKGCGVKITNFLTTLTPRNLKGSYCNDVGYNSNVVGCYSNDVECYTNDVA